MKIHNVVSLKATSLGGDIYKAWLYLTAPFHKLSNKEIIVLSSILRLRDLYSKTAPNEGILYDFIWSDSSRAVIAEEGGVSRNHLNVLINKLRNKGALDNNNRVNPRLIPHIEDGTLNLLFNIIGE